MLSSKSSPLKSAFVSQSQRPTTTASRSMKLIDAAAASAVAPRPSISGSAQPTLVDESLESLDTSYQGYYKELPDQVWSHTRREASTPELTTTSSPSSSSMPSDDDDNDAYSQTATAPPPMETPRKQQTSRTKQQPALITPPPVSSHNNTSNTRRPIVPFASTNTGLVQGGDAIRALQHELKFARQEIRELKERVLTETTACSDTVVVDGTPQQTPSNTNDAPPTNTVIVQPPDEQLWQRLEASEQRAQQLTRQLRESNHMAAKLYRSLKLSHVQLQTLQVRLGESNSSMIDMGLVVQQSQWLRCCILVGPILLLTGHVELFAVLVVLSGITLELATSY